MDGKRDYLQTICIIPIHVDDPESSIEKWHREIKLLNVAFDKVSWWYSCWYAGVHGFWDSGYHGSIHAFGQSRGRTESLASRERMSEGKRAQHQSEGYTFYALHHSRWYDSLILDFPENVLVFTGWFLSRCRVWILSTLEIFNHKIAWRLKYQLRCKFHHKKIHHLTVQAMISTICFGTLTSAPK